jgi:hypothetical protein
MTKQGSDLERVINLIQKSIEPDAIVEHNVFLPVIGSKSGRSRQCDTVITSGPKHRKTITIVEVQDRSSQVDINTFIGWLGKLDEIGEQHLICVSRLEYPESIKEKTLMLGNKVKLITLKNTAPNEIPESFFKSNIKYIKFQITKLNSPKLGFSIDEAKSLGIYDSINLFLKRSFKSDERIFSLDKITLISLHNLCQDSNENPEKNGIGNNILEFSRTEGQPLYFFIDDRFTRIGLKIEFSWKNEVQEFPFSILSYEQQGDGSLAWIYEAKFDTQNGPVSVKIPFVKKEDLYLIPGMVTHISQDHSFIIQIKKDSEET